jgi:hypothetical protein
MLYTNVTCTTLLAYLRFSSSFLIVRTSGDSFTTTGYKYNASTHSMILTLYAFLWLGAASNVVAECCKVPIKCTNGLTTTYVRRFTTFYGLKG